MSNPATFNLQFSGNGFYRLGNRQLKKVVNKNHEENKMENTNLTENQIIDALNEMGETGSYKVQGEDLLIQKEENANFKFYGGVESQEQVDKIFEGLNNL